jgi:hypothetical protein
MQELKASEVAAVCAGLAEQGSAGGIIHNSDPMLATQVSGAVRLHSGDGRRFAERGVDHVDGVYATGCCASCVDAAPRERDRWSSSPAAARDDSITTFVDVSTP